MDSYQRTQVATLLSRLSEKPRLLTLVTGPRQTGKSTLVRQALGHSDQPSRYLSVDDPEPDNLPPDPNADGFDPEPQHARDVLLDGPRDTRWLVRNWQLARLAADRSAKGFVLAIDEIQKIPNWSEAVKGLWDADRRHDRPLHVVLLGSAPLLMQQGLSESLAGRFETVRLMHWSFVEMSDAFGFDLQRYIYFGGYPGSVPYVPEQTRWRTYVAEALVEPNIERDILAMQRVDKPALLKRLFQLGAEYSGQILSYNKMLGQLQDAGNTTTLARYMDLLSNAGLVAGLPKFAGRTHRRRSSSPKLNVLNTALMSVASGYTFEEAKADRSHWGRLVESAVGAHLLNTGTPDHRLYYWRENGSEVDFILERGRRIVAFEVKSSARRARTSGLQRFTERFDVVESVVVGEGGVPLSEFLATPAREWFEQPMTYLVERTCHDLGERTARRPLRQSIQTRRGMEGRQCLGTAASPWRRQDHSLRTSGAERGRVGAG